MSAGDLGKAGPPRAQLVGTGLIGASVGLALRQRGWHVTGTDAADGLDAGARPGRKPQPT